ncbi:MAG: helix-turn-helix transcriptional regulator [Clostridia bacterium]|nr:helix-turn-helix transcriptional regulator [Clostridia bacterium]
MKFEKELFKGNTDMLVLILLSKEDLYGYKLIRKLEENSKDIFSLKEGTLYPILHSLEKQQLVESYWEESISTRKRKFYKITDKGQKALKEKKSEWNKYVEGVNNLLTEVDYIYAK